MQLDPKSLLAPSRKSGINIVFELKLVNPGQQEKV